MPTRLNKFLGEQGVCSRREADKLIAEGKITINGRKAVMGEKIEGTEEIIVDGKAVNVEKKERVYLAYNKPVGIICTTDPGAKDNIVDSVHYPERIFNIGRLDVASSGLILLTNDGSIVNKILRAEGKHEKEYIVTMNKKITPDFIQKMKKGVELEDGRTMPTKVDERTENTFSITLMEGRNRQIRRMCSALGFEVKALTRVRIMHIMLGDLKEGEWRHLTKEEEAKLFEEIV
ncbi:MAG: pseudouridine synthase [Patescibacteria group bacterium]|jgi:23S rRNA pseudouridine2604 synthase